MTATATMTLSPLGSVSDRPSLVEDQRGAVMLTGLFMACFLIGALWFVVGIGDAIVFRDKMQEAADVGAFSSAALHAKGMNFISLCNIVMLVGTIIHIVLGIISDVKFAVMVACAASVPCWPALPGRIAAFEIAYLLWDSYFQEMSKGFRAIHVAQKTASYAYPAMGVVEAFHNGAKYGGDSRTGPVRVFAVSTSIIPGGAIRGVTAPGNIFGQASSSAFKKEGLPVETHPFSTLCTKVVSNNTTGITNILGFGKSLSGWNLGGQALSIFNALVGAFLEARYCNKTQLHFEPFGPGFDAFWGEDGPFVTYQPSMNGSVWMQSWAINISPQLHDTSQSRVGLAAKQFSKYTKEETTGGYFAQAEFYFDCDSQWYTPACDYEDSAMYAIKWRARMRRLELPALTSAFAGAALSALGNLPIAGKARDAVSGKLGEILGTSGVSQTALKAATDSVLATIERYIRVGGADAASTFDPTLKGLGATPYH